MEAPRLIEALSHEAIVLAACGRNHTLALTGKKVAVALFVLAKAPETVCLGASASAGVRKISAC